MGGYLPYIILFILSGVIAELLLWKMGYGNAKALTVSYVINQVLAAFGSTIIPYAIAAKAMADQMVTDGRQDAILAASQMLQSWVSVALVAGVIVAAFIGAMIGKRHCNPSEAPDGRTSRSVSIGIRHPASFPSFPISNLIISLC